MTETVTPAERETKPAQDVQPGDWLADGVVMRGPARVLYVHPYLLDGRRRIDITYEETLTGRPAADGFDHGERLKLATEAEIAAATKAAERVAFIAEMRTFADWLEQRPWLPVPDLGVEVMVHLYGEGSIELVKTVAERLGTEVDVSDIKTDVDAQVGGSSQYSLIAWHRPSAVQPDADPAALGDSYDRSQGADADVTPVPVGARRYPPHYAGMVGDGELVDETAPLVTGDELVWDRTDAE